MRSGSRSYIFDQGFLHYEVHVGLVIAVRANYLLMKRSGCDVSHELITVVVVVVDVLAVGIPLSAVSTLFSFSSLIVGSSPISAGCRARVLRHFSRGLWIKRFVVDRNSFLGRGSRNIVSLFTM